MYIYKKKIITNWLEAHSFVFVFSASNQVVDLFGWQFK